MIGLFISSDARSYLLLVLCVEDCRVPILVQVLNPRVKLYESVDQLGVSRAGRQH